MADNTEGNFGTLGEEQVLGGNEWEGNAGSALNHDDGEPVGSNRVGGAPDLQQQVKSLSAIILELQESLASAQKELAERREADKFKPANGHLAGPGNLAFPQATGLSRSVRSKKLLGGSQGGDWRRSNTEEGADSDADSNCSFVRHIPLSRPQSVNNSLGGAPLPKNGPFGATTGIKIPPVFSKAQVATTGSTCTQQASTSTIGKNTLVIAHAAPKPPPFDIQGHQTLGQYLSKFETWANSKFGPESTSWSSLLEDRLQGKLLRQFEALGGSSGEYDIIKSGLVEFYDEAVESGLIIRQDFETLLYEQDKSLAVNMTRCQTFFKREFSGESEDSGRLYKKLLSIVPTTQRDIVLGERARFKNYTGAIPTWKQLLSMVRTKEAAVATPHRLSTKSPVEGRSSQTARLYVDTTPPKSKANSPEPGSHSEFVHGGKRVLQENREERKPGRKRNLNSYKGRKGPTARRSPPYKRPREEAFSSRQGYSGYHSRSERATCYAEHDVCQNCGSNRHFVGSCPDIKCYACGARGHMSGSCPNAQHSNRGNAVPHRGNRRYQSSRIYQNTNSRGSGGPSNNHSGDYNNRVPSPPNWGHYSNGALGHSTPGDYRGSSHNNYPQRGGFKWHQLQCSFCTLGGHAAIDCNKFKEFIKLNAGPMAGVPKSESRVPEASSGNENTRGTL